MRSKTVTIFGVPFEIFDAEADAAMPINWLVMSRSCTDGRLDPADYQYYLVEFVVGKENWPERVFYATSAN